MKTKKAIKKILKNFDFGKVHRVMENLNWYWNDTKDGGVPTVEDLKSQAKDLLKKVTEGNYKVISSGGFEAEYRDEVLTLKFVLEEWEIDKNEPFDD